MPERRDTSAAGGPPPDGNSNGDGKGDGRVSLSGAEERERLRIQVEIILRAIPGAAVYPPGRPQDMDFLYLEGVILVRDADLDRVRAVVPGEVVDALVNGVSVYAPSGVSTLAALEEIDRTLGVGVATPEHIFYVAPTSCCPATEPSVVADPQPVPPVSAVPAAAGGGHGVLVCVVDTGLIPSLVDAQHPWLAGVTGQPEPFDPTAIGPYVGHGTFVAGVLRGVAPHARVEVEDLLNRGGAATESGILRSLSRALQRAPDIISMSAGCTTRHDLPPLVFEALWLQRLGNLKGTVLVAAAGNNGSRRPFWPAAFPWAVSVGSLDRDGRRSGFSDYGSWVDVYALGRDMVNAYPDGTYHYLEPPRIGEVAQFENAMAQWSGTSFSTPLVSGMVAARMSRTGQSGRLAADSVLRLARQHAVPGVGPVAEAATACDIDPAGP